MIDPSAPGAGVDVFFVSCHDLTPGGEGAVGQGIHEAYFWRGWMGSLVRACRRKGLRTESTDRYEEIEPWDERQRDLCRRVAGARAIIDPHYNSGGYPGSLALYRPGDPASGKLATALGNAIAVAQSTKFRGVTTNAGVDGVPRSWSKSIEQNGKFYPAGSELTILSRTAPSLAIILEPFDGSVSADYAAGLAALRSGATQRAIADVLAGFLLGKTH